MIHRTGTPWNYEKIKFFLKVNKSPYTPLFTNYLGQHHKHQWKCNVCKSKFQSNWKRMWKTVRGVAKGGCLKCANRLNYTLDQVHKELKQSGRPIICLSTDYKNNKSLMNWKCLTCNYEWKSGWKNIKGSGKCKGQGCIVCANNVKYTIEKINEIVGEKQLPITLISTVYKHNLSPLKWKCNDLDCRHEWKATWASINCAEHGCPACASAGKMERRIAIFLNKVFDNAFVKIRPEFLRYPKTGNKLEIDLFSEKLNLAIEINGIQHYQYQPFFHRSPQQFQHMLAKDAWKAKTLKKLKVNFISVPIDGLTRSKIKEFIRLELKRLNYEINSKFNDLKII
jgi:hypothetical protein